MKKPGPKTDATPGDAEEQLVNGKSEVDHNNTVVNTPHSSVEANTISIINPIKRKTHEKRRKISCSSRSY